MADILEQIVDCKRVEVESQKQCVSINQLVEKIGEPAVGSSFKNSLLDSPTGIIAEFKRRSPSKGWIFEGAKIQEIVPAYSASGATAISILTDTEFFGGTFSDFELARTLTQTPLLRKDFMVDEYQIYQAKAMGADAILLIASVLNPQQTKQFARTAKELSMEVLLEIHSEAELDHLNQYVDVVGVNNRNLGSFHTDIQTSFKLASLIPAQFLKISESGISSSNTVLDLRQAGYRGFLMGENFMKTDDPARALGEFIKELMR